MVDPTVILAGAVPAAALALGADAALSAVERRIARRGQSVRVSPKPAWFAAAALVTVAASVWAVSGTTDAIRVGSKNFTEQILLGELVAQTLERHTDVKVDRRLNLGGTFICDRALAAGEIHAYVEYTGTAATAIFKQAVAGGPDEVRARVRAAYADTGRTMLEPLGFENTFAILVRGRVAREHNLRTVSDAVPFAASWRAGFGYEFVERADGFPGLARTYGLRFASQPSVMDLSLIYRALADGQVDVTAGDATSGLIEALDLFMLEDDRRYFPPYDAVPVVNTKALAAHPELGTAIARLAGKISVRDMRAMNLAVDVGRRDAAAVVREFVERLDRQ